MSKRILVVEDQMDSLQIVRDLLRVNGYEMTEAQNGEEAIAAVTHTCCADQRQGPTLICAQRLPHAIGGCHDPITNQEFGAHKNQRTRRADEPAPGFHKLA